MKWRKIADMKKPTLSFENPKIRPKQHVELQLNKDMPMTHTMNDSFSNEAAIDEVVATCDGDMRGAIKAQGPL